MPRLRNWYRLTVLFLLVFGVLWLMLHSRPTVGECPGQFVVHSAFNHDESQLLLVTLPRSPFG